MLYCVGFLFPLFLFGWGYTTIIATTTTITITRCLSSYRSVQNLRTLGLIACEADRIGIRGSRSWSSTCAVSSVIPRLLLLTDFDKREHPTTATARRRLYGARRASRLFSTDFFFFFFFFFFFGKEETVHEPLMIPLSSILHHTRTHTRPLDASRKHTPVARPSTAEAHTINQQKGQGHRKARGRDKRISHLELGGMAYFALSSSTRPARNIHNLLLVWRRRPLTAGRPCPWVLVTLDVYFPSQFSFFQQITTTRTTTVRVSPLLPPPTLAPRCWVCVSSSSREPRWDAPCLIVVGLRQIQQGQRCWGVPQSDFRCYLPCSSGDRSSSSKWHERKKENKKNTSIFRVIDRYRCPSCFLSPAATPPLPPLLLLSYYYFSYYFYYCK